MGGVGRERAVRLRLGGHSEQPPLPRDALQLVHPVIGKDDPGAGDEVLHRARHDHLARAGQRRHARAGVDGDARDLAVHALAFAGVQPGAHLDAELAHRLDDRARAGDRPRGAVEAREEAVARGVDLDAAEAREPLTDEGVVPLEELAPRPVAQLGRFPVASTMSVKSTVARTRSGSVFAQPSVS